MDELSMIINYSYSYNVERRITHGRENFSKKVEKAKPNHGNLGNSVYASRH